MNARLAEDLKRHRERLLFDRLYRPEARAGLHMLRRSFASHVLARQADIETVRELGGWSDLSVVQRYVASTEELKRKAVEGLDFT